MTDVEIIKILDSTIIPIQRKGKIYLRCLVYLPVDLAEPDEAGCVDFPADWDCVQGLVPPDAFPQSWQDLLDRVNDYVATRVE